jgi:hypothetical protein
VNTPFPHPARPHPSDPHTKTHPTPPPHGPPGEQLNQLSGIAAVLRFPLPELEDAELIEEA